METQKKKLERQEESRDFFCVVSDAFRIFAPALIRGRSVALGLLPALSARPAARAPVARRDFTATLAAPLPFYATLVVLFDRTVAVFLLSQEPRSWDNRHVV